MRENIRTVNEKRTIIRIFPDNIVCRTYAKERVQTLNNIAEGMGSAAEGMVEKIVDY